MGKHMTGSGEGLGSGVAAADLPRLRLVSRQQKKDQAFQFELDTN